MQESLNAELVQLHTQDPGAAGGHGEEPVAHIHPLRGAVVGPQAGHLLVQERLEMVGAADRMLQQPVLVKRVVGESVHEMAALHDPGDRFDGRPVGIQLLQGGLVRDVEVGAVLQPQLLQQGAQAGQIGQQELGVLPTHSGGVPAEHPARLALFRHPDVRGGHRAPLGEQMGYLKIPDPAGLAEQQPPFQIGEVKGVFPVGPGDLHQLHRRALVAHGGVQRRGELGGQHHGDPPLRGGADEVFQNGPVRLGKDRHLVVVRQAVRVEPLGVREGDGGQFHRQDGHLGGEGGDQRPGGDILKPQRQRILARGQGRVGGHVDPEGFPLAGGKDHAVVGHRFQPVGEKARGLAQIVVVGVGVGRVGAGDTLDGADLHRLGDGGFQPQRRRLEGHRAAVFHGEAPAAVGYLKGDTFAAQRFQTGIKDGGLGLFVGEHLDQRVQQPQLYAGLAIFDLLFHGLAPVRCRNENTKSAGIPRAGSGDTSLRPSRGGVRRRGTISLSHR